MNMEILSILPFDFLIDFVRKVISMAIRVLGRLTHFATLLVVSWNYSVELVSTISTHVLFHMLLSLLLVFKTRTAGR